MRSTPLHAALAALIVVAAGTAALAQSPVPSAAPDPSRIKLEDFKKDFDAGKLHVIDVRSAEAYRSGHIPGAINVPLNVVNQRLAELKAVKKPIVAYCA
jgi:3-mercaptopyruvate sulfurtransferase SseA